MFKKSSNKKPSISSFRTLPSKLSTCLGVSCLILCLIFTSACNENPFPRPKGYPRVILPAQKSYTTFKSDKCDFSFDYPEFGKVIREGADSCLADLSFDPYGLKWHLTYRNLAGSAKPRAAHEEEYRRLVMRHAIKITFMSDSAFVKENGWGTFYQLYGEVGSPAMMFFGDSTNLVMTSLYFDHAINQDSLKPLIEYMKEEMWHFTESMEWNSRP